MLDLGYEKDVATLINKLQENTDSTPLLQPDYLNKNEKPKEEKKRREMPANDFTLCYSYSRGRKIGRINFKRSGVH